MPQVNDLRVLLVEDSMLLAMDLQYALEEAGFTVIGPAPDLQTAMALLDREHLDGALLDVDLEGTKSFPLAERLQERGVPFVFLTGFRNDQVLPPEFIDSPCLEKPVDHKQLMAIIVKLFGAGTTVLQSTG